MKKTFSLTSSWSLNSSSTTWSRLVVISIIFKFFSDVVKLLKPVVLKYKMSLHFFRTWMIFYNNNNNRSGFFALNSLRNFTSHRQAVWKEFRSYNQKLLCRFELPFKTKATPYSVKLLRFLANRTCLGNETETWFFFPRKMSGRRAHFSRHFIHYS